MQRDHLLGWQLPAQPLGPAIQRGREPTSDDNKRAERAAFEANDWTHVGSHLYGAPAEKPVSIGVDLGAGEYGAIYITATYILDCCAAWGLIESAQPECEFKFGDRVVSA